MATSQLTEVPYVEAVELTHQEPYGAHERTDLIVLWGFLFQQWHWSRQVEVTREEAIAYHRSLGEESIRLVGAKPMMPKKKKNPEGRQAAFIYGGRSEKAFKFLRGKRQWKPPRLSPPKISVPMEEFGAVWRPAMFLMLALFTAIAVAAELFLPSVFALFLLAVDASLWAATIVWLRRKRR
jgi:hypothetical protein